MKTPNQLPIHFTKLLSRLLYTLILGLFLATTVHMILSSVAFAATITVDSLSDTQANDGVCTLREAIINANQNDQSGSTDCLGGSGTDTINFSISGVIPLGSDLPAVTQNIIIDGSGQTIQIDGQNARPIFDFVTAEATVKNLTVENGNATSEGGAISAAEMLTLTNVIIFNNSAVGNGGGVSAGMLVVIDSRFERNFSQSFGGGIDVKSWGVISNSTFISNGSDASGGAGSIDGLTEVTNSHFEGNFCNKGGCNGGGLHITNQAVVANTDFINNTAMDMGGGMVLSDALTLNGGQFEGNQAIRGGAVFGQADLTITGTQFLSNTAQGMTTAGGGIAAIGAVTVQNGIFKYNTATTGDGGAVWVNNTLAATQTDFINNTADMGSGAGLYVNGGLHLNRVSLIGNTAQLNGGGVSHQGAGEGYLVNVLAARNQAGSGAGFYLGSTGSIKLLHLTIADTTLNPTQAIYAAAGTAAVTNTIITSHTVGIQQAGGNISQDYSMFFGNTFNTASLVNNGANSFTGDPAFVDIANDDYHLAFESDALNKGIDVGVIEDFDGEPRPWQGAPEIGFDEREFFKIYAPQMMTTGSN